MATRADVIVYDEWKSEPIVHIYKHWDGYPDGGLGDTLRVFCEPFTIVNGISGNDPEPFANGMGCFAAQLVGYLKSQVGDVYLVPLQADHEEYTYHIRFDNGRLKLTYQDHGEEEQPLKEVCKC